MYIKNEIKNTIFNKYAMEKIIYWLFYFIIIIIIFWDDVILQ